MPHGTKQPPETCQARFARRWGHLTRPHVRALAWLLDAPDLLDAASMQWGGRIATLDAVGAADADWLAALQHDPALLDAALGTRHYSRLGLYAEKLLAFYFAQRGVLVAHGLQVRAAKNDTVGEFDFLLRRDGALAHWEFATKFYLLDGAPDAGRFNRLIGPNLADSLGLKMRKIIDKQLSLASHPAAQSLLPGQVDSAQALVKGWLFYPGGAVQPMEGIAAAHNHGFWSTLAQLDALAGERFVVLPRLQWLAPLKVAAGVAVLSRDALREALALQFAAAPAAVMVAAVHEANGWEVEWRRGFIVPDDWAEQAAARRAAGKLPQ
ncbi:DUF1853 family protein [Janthinobacterium fluminis]|uniref:DUF1853 family protein n=1 Tax=Janthinobacterium fluminis TaxID=2987524 RepID=A0ABT5JXG6_9BURK|nr:DUF1853 family protein [Janthinobacterium fluminis]MDC8756222.1 DUF1853 family protein [Janthinobacterium fluminis]